MWVACRCHVQTGLQILQMLVLPLMANTCLAVTTQPRHKAFFFSLMWSSWIHRCWKWLFLPVLFWTSLFLDAQDGMFGVGRFDWVQLFPPFRCVCSLRARLSSCLKISIVCVSFSFPLQSPRISLLPSPCRRLILDPVLILNPSGWFDLQARYSVLMKVNTAHHSSHPPSHRAVPFGPTGGGFGSPAAGQRACRRRGWPGGVFPATCAPGCQGEVQNYQR